MKKFFALLLCFVLVCLCISSAMAVSFSWDSSSTSFSRWSDTTSAKGGTWKISQWTQSNLSESHKAAVKVYSAPGVYASHTFYYSSTSTNSHDYLDSVTDGTDVYLAGKLHSGSGNITVAGMFEP